MLTVAVWYVDTTRMACHHSSLRQNAHMDIPEESVEENISTCVKYLKRMAPMKQWLEMEIGITV